MIKINRLSLLKNHIMKQVFRPWGRDREGRNLVLYTLDDGKGTVVSISNYGGIITSIRTPDRYGQSGEVVLGFDSADAYLDERYLTDCPYFGCITGRYAGRIACGEFSIDGERVHLPVNNGGNTLHGGFRGFDKRTWNHQLIMAEDKYGLELSYLSPHLEEGFPGNIQVKVTYFMSSPGTLTLKYQATTDRPTVVNLTNHTYFNLNMRQPDILDHRLRILSKKNIESNNLIPTGQIIDIKGTAFDFSEPKTIGRDIGQLPDGYDHGYALDNDKGGLIPAAVLSEPVSGRQVEIFTDQPSVHIYTGYYIPALTGHEGVQYGPYKGVAIETQHYPDSPNHPGFPCTLLRPGEVFESITSYRFSAGASM